MTTTTEPRFPDVTVPLVGEDGNAFAILGRVTKALRRGGATQADIDEFTDEATSGDYDDLLLTVTKWVSMPEDEDDEYEDEFDLDDDDLD
jgi:hypothetical protein